MCGWAAEVPESAATSSSCRLLLCAIVTRRLRVETRWSHNPGVLQDPMIQVWVERFAPAKLLESGRVISLHN